MSAAAEMRSLLRRTLKPSARIVRRAILPRLLPSIAHGWPSTVRSVRVVGLLSSSSGLGQSARLCASVLQDTGYQVGGSDVSALFDSNDGLPHGMEACRTPAEVSIFHLNPPMLLPSILRSNPLRYWRSFNIGYWAWELETLPAEWVGALRFVDAVMVPSSFCKRAVQRHTRKPVLVVPHPVPMSSAAPGRTTGTFKVLTIFNFGSSVERKNPFAAVRAFKDAFGSDTRCELILKVSDGRRYPDDMARLASEINGAANIRLIDEVWDQNDLAALLRSASVYLSLHRSEGFGLTLAEAISAAVPVIATNWSGNTDFCRPETSFPVDYTLVPVEDRHRSFADIGDASWAEPSIRHAVARLRQVRNHEAHARAGALRLRDEMRAYLSTSTYDAAFRRLATTCGGQQAASGLPSPREAHR